MGSFLENREKAQEDKFAHDKNLEFKINSRKNRLLSGWAAVIMEFNDYQAKEYVNKFISEGISFLDDSQAIDRIYEDCQRSFVKLDKDQIRKQNTIFKNQAYQEIMSDSHDSQN